MLNVAHHDDTLYSLTNFFFSSIQNLLLKVDVILEHAICLKAKRPNNTEFRIKWSKSYIQIFVN